MAKYQNPIIRGFYPDPSICRMGEDFYIVTFSFEFFPNDPIYHNRNLIDWELINYCLLGGNKKDVLHQNLSGRVCHPVHSGVCFFLCRRKLCANKL